MVRVNEQTSERALALPIMCNPRACAMHRPAKREKPIHGPAVGTFATPCLPTLRPVSVGRSCYDIALLAVLIRPVPRVVKEKRGELELALDASRRVQRARLRLREERLERDERDTVNARATGLHLTREP